MSSETNKRLDRILRDIQRMVGEAPFNVTDPEDLTLLGLSFDEAKDWLQNEPDFTKRIVTPLNPKQGGNRTASEILYSGFFT